MSFIHPVNVQMLDIIKWLPCSGLTVLSLEHRRNGQGHFLSFSLYLSPPDDTKGDLPMGLSNDAPPWSIQVVSEIVQPGSFFHLAQ